MAKRARSTIWFLLIGVMIYACIYGAAEHLLYRNGHANPLFKMAAAKEKSFDWVILGASHAMPLDFADFNDRMQKETGLRIINLASPGTGPLYNRFVLEAFLRKHSAANVLYVADSFAFYSRAWNEDRFADAKLLRTTPFSIATAELLWRYCRDENVDPRSLLDYLTGFSKINNRDRFQRDIWEGEHQWDRVYRGSASAIGDRIEYLYPAADRGAVPRYVAELDKLLDMTAQRNMRVTVVKMPVPAAYRARLPNEKTFDEALVATLANRASDVVDLSASLDEARFYFDTDHLNRAGIGELFQRHLKPVLIRGAAPDEASNNHSND